MKLRDYPIVLSEEEVKRMIRDYDFYEEDINPDGMGFDNRFSRIEVDIDESYGIEVDDRVYRRVVIDLTTQLMWWWDSGLRLNFNQMKQRRLNTAYVGFTDWRIPTLPELFSIITHDLTNIDSGHMDLVWREDSDDYIYTSADRVKKDLNIYGQKEESYWEVTRHGNLHDSTHLFCKPVRTMERSDYQNPRFRDGNFNGYATDYYNKEHHTTLQEIRSRY